MKRRIRAAVCLGAMLILGRSTFGQNPDEYSTAGLAKARAELAAAEKAAGASPTSAAKARIEAARQRLWAQEAWSARQVADKVNEARVNAEKLLAAKSAAVKKAKQKAAASKNAADQAAVDKAVAEQAAAQKSLMKAKPAWNAAADAAAAAHAKALGGLEPIKSDQWNYQKARHLLFRAGFGGTPDEIQKLVDMGLHKAVDYLVEYHERPVANVELQIKSWERPLAYERRLHPEAMQQLEEADGLRNVNQHAAMVRWWVQRLVDSPRPLEEKLVLFWHSHFASSYRTLGDAYLMHQQNQFLRQYADNFDALLHGCVQDPAMLLYLNNNENVNGSNNENLGRELLELFSMGEENCSAHRTDGYSEKDVRDGNTRSLTGATFERYSRQFRFYVTQHDTSPKTLLGKTGPWGPHEAVDIMLEHPATARYVTKKLLQFFVYPEPEPAVVDQMAKVLRENGYRMRPFLQNLFLSQEFYSDKAMGGQIKSPVELLVGTAKIVKFSNLSHQNIRFLLAAMGQSLFDPPSVAGWPGGRDWVNTNLLMARYTAVADFVKESKPDLVAQLKGRELKSPADVVDHLAKRCLLVELSPQKRAELIRFLGPLPPTAEWDKQAKQINAKLVALLVLLVSSPEYQVG